MAEYDPLLFLLHHGRTKKIRIKNMMVSPAETPTITALRPRPPDPDPLEEAEMNAFYNHISAVY